LPERDKRAERQLKCPEHCPATYRLPVTNIMVSLRRKLTIAIANREDMLNAERECDREGVWSCDLLRGVNKRIIANALKDLFWAMLPRTCSRRCLRGGRRWFCGNSRQSLRIVRNLRILRYCRINKLRVFQHARLWGTQLVS
jgi:hypothetical protein